MLSSVTTKIDTMQEVGSVRRRKLKESKETLGILVTVTRMKTTFPGFRFGWE